ncbi:MAG: FKBP-type peptidyl-prolyl cis-trans isomerase [Phycisphaerales bacterium]
MSNTSPQSVGIEDTVVGSGAECTSARQTVKVHYRGTLLSGKEFDSSYTRGQPIEFRLGDLIQGWQEGIPGMKVGGKRTLTIPWQKAYGERGSPPTIPPKADLIFDIELLGVR